MDLQNMEKTEEKVMDIVKEFTSASMNDLQTKSLDEAEIDSLAKAEILFRLEEDFQISIEDEELQGVQKFHDLVDLIKKKKQPA